MTCACWLTEPVLQHWNPYSGLFTQDEYAAVHVSNVAIAAMSTSLYVLARCTSWTFVVKIYLIPFLLTNHWYVRADGVRRLNV